MQKPYRIIAVFVVALAAFSVQADPQFRISADFAADFMQRPTVEEVRSVFDDQSTLFWGPQMEIIVDRVGFGWHTLVNFDHRETGFTDPAYDWTLDWLGDFFVSYHFFGGGSFLDPFVELGFGNAGRVDLGDESGYWAEIDGAWKYEVAPWDPTEEAVQNLALYPYVGAGLALDLGGLLVGARLAYRPTVLPIPATQFEVYPLTNFQVGLFGGIALGGH